MPHCAHRVLADYLLYNDLADSTAHYYRRVVSVYSGWLLNNQEKPGFTPESVSLFLRDMQTNGASPYYVKSLRNGLRALLNFSGQRDRVRTVKIVPLELEAWSAIDVALLVQAAPAVIMPNCRSSQARDRRWYWRTIIPAAWYTGLSQGDLFRLTRDCIGNDGRTVMRRSRTNKVATVWLPPGIIAEIGNRDGAFWRPRTSQEYFRREFDRIVKAACLSGTFKKLRKSSGTAVEVAYPGRGHEHLANTRKVFEAHYLARNAMQIEPMRPPMLTIP